MSTKLKNIQPLKSSKEDTIKLLMENSVALQRVVTNLAINLDSLSKQIENLLKLFEMSAKSVAEKTVSSELDSRKILQKIDNLTEQNKVIAKSLTLMHENTFSAPASITNASQQPPAQNQQQSNEVDFRGYQKSISSR